jgi:DNA-binding LacI/PurR family transcriptional regulator
MKKDATVRDVARQANVSTATVSRVLNNSPAVRAGTRLRVLEAMEALNFQPNLTARRLSVGRTNTIAVILPLFTLPSFVERLRGIHAVLAETEYDLVLYSVETPEKRDDYFARLAHPSRADGLILVSLPPNDEQAKRFIHSGIPVVLVDAVHPDMNRIYVDDRAGGRLATQHLIDQGHTRIAYLSDYLDTPFHPSMHQRFEGYRAALADAGIPFRPEYHVMGDHERQAAHELALSLFALPEPPTAIFAASDTQAIGVMDAAFMSGIHIPHSLSVIGFDGIRDSEYVKLTTVQQPLYESGARGAEMMLQLLDKEISGIHDLLLPVCLIKRNTTAPPENR